MRAQVHSDQQRNEMVSLFIKVNSEKQIDTRNEVGWVCGCETMIGNASQQRNENQKIKNGIYHLSNASSSYQSPMIRYSLFGYRCFFSLFLLNHLH